MACLLNYDKFSKTVPAKTKEFVDSFLNDNKNTLINLFYSSIEDSEYEAHIRILLLLHACSNGNDETKVFLNSKNLDKEFLFNYVKDQNHYNYNDKDSIPSVFEKVAEYFCVCDYVYEYLYLTSEEILYKNFEALRYIPTYIDSVRKVILSIDGLNSFDSLYKPIYLNSKHAVYSKLQEEYFGNLPIEVIDYLETVSKYQKTVLKSSNIEKFIMDDLLVANLLVSLYRSDYTKNIVDYFSYIGIPKDKFLSEINDLARYAVASLSYNNNVNNEIPDLAVILSYYYRYLKLNNKDDQSNNKKAEFTSSNVFSVDIPSAYDIVIALADRKISGSFMFEKLMKKFNVDMDNIKNIKTRIIDYKDQIDRSNKKELLNNFYRDYSNETVEEIKNISKIYKIVKQKNDADLFKTKYEIKELISISILIDIFNSKKIIPMYLNNYDITLETFLNYLDLGINDISSTDEVDVNSLKETFDEIKKIDNNCDMEFIFTKIFDSNYGLNKILKNINPKIPSAKITKDMNKFIINEIQRARVKILKRFYADLNIDVIKFIELAALFFEDLSDEILINCDINDKIEIAILFSYLKEDNIVSRYIKNCLFKGNYVDGTFGITTNKQKKSDMLINHIYNKEVDDKLIIKHFGKYVFGGINSEKQKSEIKIIDILKNCFNKEVNYSLALEDILDSIDLSYEDFIDIETKASEYEKEQERKKLENLKNEVLNSIKPDTNFDTINSISKIFRIIRKWSVDDDLNYDVNVISIASLIYLYYSNSSLTKILENRNITLDSICTFLKIPKEEMDKFNQLDTDYNRIKDLKSVCMHIFSDSVDKLVKLFIEDTKAAIGGTGVMYITQYRGLPLKSLIESTKNDFNTIYREVVEGKIQLTKEQRLEQYSNLPIPNLEINKIEQISEFGNALTEQSEIITREFSDFLDERPENEQSVDGLLDSINDIKRNSKQSKISLFRKKSNEENNLYSKKEVLNRLDEYLKEKEKSLKNGLLELQHIRTSIGVYLTKSDAYLNRLSEAKISLNEEISHRVYADTDFRVYDDQLKQQMIDDKISSINESIIRMLQQYDRITLQMSVSASLINQINIARGTTLQNLYIELSLNESITKQKDTIDSLNGLVNLLNNMSAVNSNGVVDNISRINAMNKNNVRSLTEQDKILIRQVLEEQGLLGETIEVQDKTKVK